MCHRLCNGDSCVPACVYGGSHLFLALAKISKKCFLGNEKFISAYNLEVTVQDRWLVWTLLMVHVENSHVLSWDAKDQAEFSSE